MNILIRWFDRILNWRDYRDARRIVRARIDAILNDRVL